MSNKSIFEYQDDDLLTPGVFGAAIGGRTEGTLAVWRSTGRYAIPYIKSGSNVLYRAKSGKDYLLSRTQVQTPSRYGEEQVR
jgi:hypothetical protein